MSDIVSPLLQWLNTNPQLAGIATFVISASESIAIIGTIVPGSVTMTAIGTLAGAGVIPLWSTILWAILGAIVGDGISYWLGHAFKGRIRNSWIFRNNPALLDKGEKFVTKYGVMSVFMGRFVGPVRALVPLIAGMLGMRPLQFTLANIASAIGWAPAYMLPGILLGAASLELPPDIAIHVILVLLLITFFIVSCLWIAYKIFILVHTQMNEYLARIWHRMIKSRQFAPLTSLLKHHNKTKMHGQLSLAIGFVVMGSLFVLLAIYIKMVGAENVTANQAIYHLFRGIRSDTADNVMIYITMLGQKEVVIPAIVIFFAWLLILKRWRVALHAVTLGVLAAGSVFVIKNIIKSPRPWGIFASPETYSMPSGHATLSTTVFLGLAFLIARSVRESRRWIIYSIALLFVLLVGMSRLYLGAHWFTDIISAWLLSITVLLFVIISFQRRLEKPVEPWSALLVSFGSLAAMVMVYQYSHFNGMSQIYAQSNWPSAIIDMKEWWQSDNDLPAYRVSLFGFQSQKINIEWVGDLTQIRDSLMREGWNKPPARDIISTLHRVSAIKSTEYLPLVSPQYLDKRPALILTRFVRNNRRLQVLRLWDTNRTMSDSNLPLWVGMIGVVPRSYSWIYKKNHDEFEIDPSRIFPVLMGNGQWQWKSMFITIPLNTNEFEQQKVMLIRPKPQLNRILNNVE